MRWGDHVPAGDTHDILILRRLFLDMKRLSDDALLDVALLDPGWETHQECLDAYLCFFPEELN